MKVLWTLVKIVIALCVAIPVSIFVLATALGILGAMVGIAFLVFKLGIIALVGYGVFRIIAALLGGGSSKSQPVRPAELPAVDPYYKEAMRELDRELGPTSR